MNLLIQSFLSGQSFSFYNISASLLLCVKTFIYVGIVLFDSTRIILIINILIFQHTQNEITVRNKISQNLCVLGGRNFNYYFYKISAFHVAKLLRGQALHSSVTFKCQTITLDITTKPHHTNTINSRYYKISETL